MAYVVKLLNVTQVANISLCQKVDSNTFATKAARTTYSVDVVLAVCRQIIVYDQRHLNNDRDKIRVVFLRDTHYLLHVNSTCEQIGRD